ncbi:MAG: hypothetical protein U0031_20470 [Thermomicrobiales bacterium]
MDQERFDRFARGLASAGSRRGFVRGLAGSVLVGIAAVGTHEATAGKEKKKRGGCRAPRVSCGKGKQAQCCARGQICDKGVCTTPCQACSAECPGVAETNPVKTVSFRAGGNPDYCSVIVNLAGFAGCTEVTADYWTAIRLDGSRANNLGSVALGPTDLSGASEKDLGTYAKGGAVDIRLPGASAAYQYVEC